MMREYEITCVIDPNIGEEELPALLEKFSNQIVNLGGQIIAVDNLGKKRLAFEIKGKTEGIYVNIRFSSNPEAAKELGRIIRLSDQVLRNITIRNN
jgi:small subunit ribosomal protein S6